MSTVFCVLKNVYTCITHNRLTVFIMRKFQEGFELSLFFCFCLFGGTLTSLTL